MLAVRPSPPLLCSGSPRAQRILGDTISTDSTHRFQLRFGDGQPSKFSEVAGLRLP